MAFATFPIRLPSYANYQPAASRGRFWPKAVHRKQLERAWPKGERRVFLLLHLKGSVKLRWSLNQADRY
jgi:hypothetical protein